MATNHQADAAVIQKAAWKAPALNQYATALVRAGRRIYLDTAVGYFNNDDVPEADQPGDKTTVGAGFRMLLAAGVIEPWRGTDEARGIYGGMRRSSRQECHGHRNQLYRVVSVALAEEWLARHGVVVVREQKEFAFR